MSRAEIFVSGYLSGANINKEVNWNAMDQNPAAWSEGYQAYCSFQDFLNFG